MPDKNELIPEKKKPMPTEAKDSTNISLDGFSKLDMELLDIFSQEEISLIKDIAWDLNEVNKDAITLGLDQEEIPEDWNFSFMTMQPHASQTLRSKIQATIPPNRVAYNHLLTVWHIDSGATSHIYTHCSMFEKYTKVE